MFLKDFWVGAFLLSLWTKFCSFDWNIDQWPISEVVRVTQVAIKVLKAVYPEKTLMQWKFWFRILATQISLFDWIFLYWPSYRWLEDFWRGAFLPSSWLKFGGFDWTFDQWPISEVIVSDTIHHLEVPEAEYLEKALFKR